ncbi:golgin subfamily A member 2-like [Perognathus longimembris pacificus]|uniref:golgin subfamily A member 2-like n=1 Tax=Perognathus longimembris pacificus TaxID=214514 RepID=UPI0020190F0F|nr:golgin subfamily A member 2-like [Perognathus longimembris pacificus]
MQVASDIKVNTGRYESYAHTFLLLEEYRRELFTDYMFTIEPHEKLLFSSKQKIKRCLQQKNSEKSLDDYEQECDMNSIILGGKHSGNAAMICKHIKEHTLEQNPLDGSNVGNAMGLNNVMKLSLVPPIFIVILELTLERYLFRLKGIMLLNWNQSGKDLIRHTVRARRSEETSQNQTAAANQLRQEYQQNCPASGPAQSNTKKKTVKSHHPKRNTTGYGQSTKRRAKGHTSPEPALPSCSSRASWVESVIAPNSIEDLRRHYQSLMLTLHCSKLQNQQLSSEIHQLKAEKKLLQHRQQKENWRRAQEKEAMQKELEAHKVTIQMLVEEERNLHCALAHMQQVFIERKREQEGVTSRQQAAPQQVAEQDIALNQVTTQQDDTQKKNPQLIQDQKQSRSGDLEEINSELQRKLQVLCTQKLNMQNRIHKLQKAAEERAVLKRQVDNLRRLVMAMRSERDNFAIYLRRERAMCEDMIQQQSQEMKHLREERERGQRQVLELEVNLEEVRKQLAELQAPAGPAQAEQQLQAQALQMQEEVKDLKQQLHLQVQENHSLRLQNLEQQERLCRLEQAGEEPVPRPAEDRHKTKDTERCTHVQDGEMEDPLLQLQDAFHQLSGEKEELASALSSEQHLKEQLQEKLKQQENNLQKWKEEAERASFLAQEGQKLQGQYRIQLQKLRDTCDRHTFSNWKLRTENDALQEQLQTQNQLLEQLKQEQEQSKLLAQMEREQLQDTLKCLEAARQEKEQLQAQLSGLAFPPEGQAVSNGEERGAEATPLDVTVPDDVDSPQDIRDIFQKYQTKLDQEALLPRTRTHGLFGKRKRDTQGLKRELQLCFSPDLPDKVDFQSGVDDLQQRCSQLSDHITAIEKSIVTCKEQMEDLEALLKEKDEHVDLLSQEKQQKKKELQELLLRLAAEGLEGQDKMQADTEAPAADTTSDLAGPMKIECSEEHDGLEEIPLDDDVEPSTAGPAVQCPLEDSTKHVGGLGNERPIPFWSRLLNFVKQS